MQYGSIIESIFSLDADDDASRRGQSNWPAKESSERRVGYRAGPLSERNPMATSGKGPIISPLHQLNNSMDKIEHADQTLIINHGTASRR
jgi:hypothetical protein